MEKVSEGRKSKRHLYRGAADSDRDTFSVVLVGERSG